MEICRKKNVYFETRRKLRLEKNKFNDIWALTEFAKFNRVYVADDQSAFDI